MIGAVDEERIDERRASLNGANARTSMSSAR